MAVESEIVQLEHMIGTLKEKILLLEKINDRLNRELLQRKKRQMARVGFVLLMISGLSAFFSFYFSSLSLEIATIFAFFIGFFFIFYESEDKISTSMVNEILYSAIYPLNAVITEMEVKGTAFYIPPNKALKEGRIFIPFEEFNDNWPNFEELSLELRKMKIEKTGVSIIPIGYGLYIQLTKELGLDYRKLSLEELTQRLPYILVDVYELADEAKIWQDRDYIYFQLERLKIRARLGQALINGPIASPVCSAVALTISQVIGRYIRVIKTEYDDDSNSVMSVYEIGVRAR